MNTGMNFVLGAFVGMLVLTAASSTATAQDSGQLPPYYKDVVTEAQKKQIYAIQSQHDKKKDDLRTQIEQLQKQLDLVRQALIEVEKDEDAAVESVLSPEQLATVKKKYAEAQARRAEAALKAAEAAAKAAAEAASGN